MNTLGSIAFITQFLSHQELSRSRFSTNKKVLEE
jgi:hypothetical protein